MKMLKRIFLPSQMVLLLMLLLGSSTASFSANSSLPEIDIQEASQDPDITSHLNEQVVNLYDYVLPSQKDIFFTKG